jgi:TolB-like protein
MKNLSFLFLITFSLLAFKYNAQTKTAAVVSVFTQGTKISPEMAESILRIELTKSEKFNVLDKLDMMETINETAVDVSNCFGKNCLSKVGKAAAVDKIVTGSIENLGKKIVVTVKVLDIATEAYDKIAIEEFIVLENEFQNMVHITLNKALGIENDVAMMNNFVYYNQPPVAPTTYIKNNGPRMGLTFMEGNLGEIIKQKENEGGYGIGLPLFSQIGYQFEQAYLSAGTFQVLIEGLVFLNGIERNQFNPSFAFLNGFRSSDNGWEFAFGPTLRFSKIADGYYLNDDKTNMSNWRLTDEWVDDPARVITDSTEIMTWNNGQVGTGNYNYSYNNNPNSSTSRLDSRGDIKLQAGFVFAIGKTFHSGYLNIPVNFFYSTSREGGGYLGLSMGFNIAQKD